MEKHPKLAWNLVWRSKKDFRAGKEPLIWYKPLIWYIWYIPLIWYIWYIPRILYQPLISSWIIPLNSPGLRQTSVSCRKCPDFTHAAILDVNNYLPKVYTERLPPTFCEKQQMLARWMDFVFCFFLSPFYIYIYIYTNITVNNYR